MFGFFKKKEKEKSTAVSVEVKSKTPGGNGVVDAATGIAITDAARAATDNANAVYAKPTQYMPSPRSIRETVDYMTAEPPKTMSR